MDMSASIASTSMAMSQSQFQQQAGVSILKKSMDVSSQLAMGTIEMMNDSAKAFAGDIGAVFDARA
ncbi:MAG: YjfB family protein [Oscillospiraceae bacterium]